MEDLLKHFPALGSYTYLDTPANGIVPHSVIKWRRQHDQFLIEDPAGFRKNHAAHLDRIRMKILNHFNAGKAEIGLVPNFSFAINIFLDGLPKGTKILLLKNDYPSINWPVQTRDFKVEYVDIDENLENNISETIQKYQPDVFIFSIVQWLNGIKIDLDFLKQLKQNHSNLLLVADATQFLGTEKFDFANSGIDVIAASAYKWLLGGFGCGFIMLKEDVKEKIDPKTIGFNSAATMSSGVGETSFIKHFEPGHLDTLNFGSLEKSLEFAEEYGTKQIYSEISNLSNLAKSRFTELGLLDKSVVLRDSHSSIFNLNANSDVYKKIRSANIYCSQRGEGIRIGFHFYNTEADLEKVIEVLDK